MVRENSGDFFIAKLKNKRYGQLQLPYGGRYT